MRRGREKKVVVGRNRDMKLVLYFFIYFIYISIHFIGVLGFWGFGVRRVMMMTCVMLCGDVVVVGFI